MATAVEVQERLVEVEATSGHWIRGPIYAAYEEERGLPPYDPRLMLTPRLPPIARFPLASLGGSLKSCSCRRSGCAGRRGWVSLGTLARTAPICARTPRGTRR
jgi:hypothetical protein